MTALQVVGICAAAAVACALLRPVRPEDRSLYRGKRRIE